MKKRKVVNLEVKRGEVTPYDRRSEVSSLARKGLIDPRQLDRILPRSRK